MKKREHKSGLIAQNALRIKKEGVVFFDDINEAPYSLEPFVTQVYVIGIVHRGTLRMLYDSEPYTISPRVISVVYPSHILHIKKVSGDFRGTIIALDESMIDEPLLEIINQTRYRYESRPIFPMPKHEFDIMMQMVNVIRETLNLDIPDKRSLLALQIRCFLSLLNYHRKRKLNDDIAEDRVSSKFHTDVAKHYRKHRDVAFYAELSGLTPKHFSAVIKRETGKNAAGWIHTHVVSEAKKLLQLRRDLTIQSVAYLLGFDDQAVFSRYFKRETGISPKEFREETQHPGSIPSKILDNIS